MSRSRLRCLLIVALLAATMSPLARSEAQVGSNALLAPAGLLERMPGDAIAAFGPRIIPPNWDNPKVGNANKPYAGTILPIPQARQLWQIFTIGAGATDRETSIAIRDLDSLHIVHTLRLPPSDGHLRRGALGGAGGEWMHAVDGTRRIFVVNASGAILEIDLQTFAIKRFDFQTPGSAAFVLGGLAYDPWTDELVGVFGGLPSFNAANTATLIMKRNLKTGALSNAHQLRACTGPLPPTDQSQTYATPPLITPDHYFVTCHRAGQVGAVVRLAKADAFDNDAAEDLTVGPVYLETAMVDQTAGRLFLITIKGEIWAFDTKTMSFVGVVGAHGEASSTISAGYGLDEMSGRVFFQSGTYGLGVAEGRFFPIPQARTLPKTSAIGQERIHIDGKTGRVFVLTGKLDLKQHAYAIFQSTPAPVPPAPPDPDRNTIDRAEQAGVTDTRYNASGSGYGARTLLANGVSTVVPAPTVGVLAPTAEAIVKYVNSKCGFTDREMTAGRVSKAEYDTGSTAAQAIAVGVDERTQLDLTRPSRCDVNLKDGSGERFTGIFSQSPVLSEQSGPGWGHRPAACTSSQGGTAKTATGEDDGQPLGTSEVVCPLPGEPLRATASATLEGAVRVGKAMTTTEIKKEARGLVAHSVATAQDIDIAAGAIHIDEVKSVAESVSNGRPKRGAMSTHTITFKGVSLAGVPLCSTNCDISSVLTSLNQAASGRAQFRTAEGVDGGLREGSPRGALTAVQKSAQRQASDRALIGDFTNEVPGLEMIVYNDNTQWGRARQLYQFAGVATSSTYNITLLPTGLGFDLSEEPPLEDESATASIDAGIPALVDASAFPSVDSPVLDAPPVANFTPSSSNVVRRTLDAIGRGIRLFFGNPRQAVLLMTAWALLGLPALLSRRRRLLAAARST